MNIVVKTKFYFQCLPALGLLLGSTLLTAQDIHFSQFYHSPLTLNPALTGVSKGDIRISGIYRSQWNAANSPYRTMQVGAEKKFYTVAHQDWWLSGGLNLLYDRAGDGNLATTGAAVNGSYTKMLNRENFLTLGASAGFGQRRFEFGKYTFDNQWNGDVFDPNRNVNENFADQDILFPTFGLGFNWRGQQSAASTKPRSKMDIGVAAYHLNTPNQNFQKNDGAPLPVRLSFYFMPTVQLNQKSDIVAQGTFQKQSDYTEILGGVGYRYYLSTKKSKELALQFGLGVRLNSIGDAIIPAAELQYRDLLVGLSWDLTVSDFSVATNRNGGPEIAVRYIFHKVHPLRAFKACPLI